MSEVQTKAIIGATVTAAAGIAASLAYFYLRKADEPIPTKWKKIGKIVDLNFFPVKSFAPIKESSFDCHILGISNGDFFDRCFIVASPNKKQITARTYPKMVLIQPKIIGNQLILSAADKSDITLDLDEIKTKKVSAKIGCWYSSVDGIDCGDAVAEWLSEFIVGKKDSVRLFYYPYLYPTKGKAKEDKIHKQLLADDAGIYHDETSYYLINQGSVDELNSHLDQIVKPSQFRPNFLVKGPNAFDEDHWKWIRIGENAIFRVVKPCARCIFTNINPDTGERNPMRQPLETLIERRTIIPKQPPHMGIHLGIRLVGTVTIGDEVYVENDDN